MKKARPRRGNVKKTYIDDGIEIDVLAHASSVIEAAFDEAAELAKGLVEKKTAAFVGLFRKSMTEYLKIAADTEINASLEWTKDDAVVIKIELPFGEEYDGPEWVVDFAALVRWEIDSAPENDAFIAVLRECLVTLIAEIDAAPKP